MTYSRPQTRTLFEREGLRQANSPGRTLEPGGRRTSVSRAGDRVDARNPANALASGRVRAQEIERDAKDIERFLDTIVEVGKSVYEGYEEEKVNQEVASFLSEPGNVQNLSAGDRSLIRGMRRESKERVQLITAERIFRQRNALYQNQIAGSAILQGDALTNIDDEETRNEMIAAERLRINKLINEQFPITGLSSAAIANKAAAETAAVDAALGNAYGNRLRARDEKELRANLEGLVSGFDGVLNDITVDDLTIPVPGEEGGEGIEIQGARPFINGQTNADLVNGIVGRIEDLRNPADGRPPRGDQEIVDGLFSQLETFYQRKRAEFAQTQDPSTLWELLIALESINSALEQTGLSGIAPTGSNIPMSANAERAMAEIAPQLNKANEGVLIYRAQQAIRNGDTRTVEAIKQYLVQTGNAEAALSLQKVEDAQVVEGTPEQKKNAGVLSARIMSTPPESIDIDELAKDLEGRVQAGQITAGMQAELLNQAIGLKNQGRSIDPNAEKWVQQYVLPAQSLAQELLSKMPSAFNNGAVDPELVQVQAGEILTRLNGKLQTWIMQQKAAGNQPTVQEIQNQATAIWKGIEEEYRKSGATTPIPRIKSPEDIAAIEVDFLKKRIRANNGVIDKSLFQQRFLLANPNKTPDELLDLFVQQMSQLEVDGKRPYQNLGVEIRKEIKGARSGVPSRKPRPNRYQRRTGSEERSRQSFDYKSIIDEDGSQVAFIDAPDEFLSLGPELLNEFLGTLDQVLMGAPAQAATLDSQPQQQSEGQTYAAVLPPQQEVTLELTPENQIGATFIQALADPAGMRAPAIASGGPLQNLINATQEGMRKLGEFVRGDRKLKPNDPPLPQASPVAPATPVPLVFNAKNPFVVALGIAEGNLNPDGSPTRHYWGHGDPNDGAFQVGIFSARGVGKNPKAADKIWFGKLNKLAPTFDRVLRGAGAVPGTIQYNRLMFNLLDAYIMSPQAVMDRGGLLERVPGLVRGGATIEAIAKARADSYYDPATGRLMTSFPSYAELLRVHRSRAGVFDYKRKL